MVKILHCTDALHFSFDHRRIFGIFYAANASMIWNLFGFDSQKLHTSSTTKVRKEVSLTLARCCDRRKKKKKKENGRHIVAVIMPMLPDEQTQIIFYFRRRQHSIFRQKCQTTSSDLHTIESSTQETKEFSPSKSKQWKQIKLFVENCFFFILSLNTIIHNYSGPECHRWLRATSNNMPSWLQKLLRKLAN